MAVVWPSTLPAQFHIDGYSESPKDNVITEEMEVGPPKVRRRASVSTVEVTAQMLLTLAQKEYFQGFYRNVLFSGTIPFKKRDDHGVLREFYARSYSLVQDMSVAPYWRCTLQLWYVA